MHTIDDLTGRYGLSSRALRRRLTALRPEINLYVRRGPRNAILMTDNGLAILDRLIDLERDGTGPTAAVEQVKAEVLTGIQSAEVRPDTAEVAATDSRNELIQELRDRIESLEHQLERRDQEMAQRKHSCDLGH